MSYKYVVRAYEGANVFVVWCCELHHIHSLCNAMLYSWCACGWQCLTLILVHRHFCCVIKVPPDQMINVMVLLICANVLDKS